EDERASAQIGSEAFDAAAGHGFGAGIDQMDGPIEVCAIVVKRNRTVTRANSKISVRGVKVDKVPNYGFLFVAQGDNKLVHSVGVVVLHHMPNHWLAANFDQRFRFLDGFLG